MSFFEPGLLIILPTALAVNRERETLLEGSPDGVMIEPRVYTFEQFYGKITSEIELEGRPLSGLGRDMIFQQILEKDEYKKGWPGRSASSGLRRQLLELLEYFKEAGLSPREFTQLTSGLGAKRVWNGLSGLYSDYEQTLGERQLVDRAGTRREILETLDGKKPLRVLFGITKIMVRDFNSLTPYQLKTIKSLARRIERVEVRLNCPGWVLELDFGKGDDADNPFNEILALARNLESMGAASGGLEIEFSTGDGEVSGPLSWIRKNLFNPSPQRDGCPEINGSIQITAEPGRYAEVEAIGRSIFSLLEQGTAPEKIAVAFNDLGTYGQLVEDVFRRFNLPLFFRRGSPLAVQAPVRALLVLLRLAESRWEREAVLNILSSPYLDFDINLPWPRIESLSLQAGIIDERVGETWVSNLRKLARNQPNNRPEINELVAAIQSIKKMIEPLTRNQTWSQLNHSAKDIFARTRIQDKVQQRFRTFHVRDTAALERLWACLDDLERAALEAGLSRVRHTPGALARGLLKAMEGQNVGQGTYQPSGVMVLDVHDLQGLEFDYLFLGGVNEGEFPHPYQESPVLSDHDRRELNASVGREVVTTSVARYRREELLIYHALASTKKYCGLSYSRMDEDTRIMLPSALLDEIIRLWPFGTIQVEEPAREIFPPLSDALSPEEMAGRLAGDFFGQQSRQGRNMALNREVLAELLERDDQRAQWRSIMDRIAFEQLRESGNTEASISHVHPKDLENWLASLPVHHGAPLLTPTFLEDYGQCPFFFWVRHVLKLEPLAEADDEISALDEGNLVHKILFDFLTRLSDENLLPLTGKAEEDRIFNTVVNESLDLAKDRIRVGRRLLWEIKRQGIFRLLILWLKKEQKRVDTLVPQYFEWSFGPEKDHPPLQAPFLNGGGIYFKGRADQIDISSDRCRVIDYKVSRNSARYKKLLKESEMGRTSFQTPAYQLAAARAFDRPAESTFYLLRIPELLKPSLTTVDDFFSTDPRERREMMNQGRGNFFNHVEETWARILTGTFEPISDDGECEYCGYRLICRARTEGEVS
ncbi:MAG: exodeoxyribonuclease V subunit gamma [Deltaproteobacteria bacterium]|nr:exodeoxyribonuclease V subunit gamma [Deltaproteobacteria bacterium]